MLILCGVGFDGAHVGFEMIELSFETFAFLMTGLYVGSVLSVFYLLRKLARCTSNQWFSHLLGGVSPSIS